MTNEWQLTDGIYMKFIGTFSLCVSEYNGGWEWGVVLEDDQVAGDNEVSMSLAMQKTEEALDLIIDEMFYDLSMHYSV